jgi:hypothetical protein
MFVYTNLNRRPGGGGCLVFGIIGIIVAYYILKGLFSMLMWAAPFMFVLALIISWRAVADVGKRFLKLLETNPLVGLIVGALAVVAFPVLSLYLVIKAIGYNQAGTSNQAFNGQRQTTEPQDDFVEFEELESRPKSAPPAPEPMKEPEIPEKEIHQAPAPKKTTPKAPPPPPKNPYEDLF